MAEEVGGWTEHSFEFVFEELSCHKYCSNSNLYSFSKHLTRRVWAHLIKYAFYIGNFHSNEGKDLTFLKVNLSISSQNIK